MRREKLDKTERISDYLVNEIVSRIREQATVSKVDEVGLYKAVVKGLTDTTIKE